MTNIERMRDFMKARIIMELDFDSTDQSLGVAQPSLQKPYDENAELIKLPEVDESVILKKNIFECFRERKSARKYTDESLSLNELSFLLWATQGVKEIRGNQYATIRLVPSGGARHAFETYLYVDRVEGLKRGIYRYIALSHELMFVKEVDHPEIVIADSMLGQKFAARSAVLFYWTCIPYRGEWRYGDAAHKVMLLDAGHLAQNLYLACEAIGCGTCAIAAYDQILSDRLLGVDGKEEFTIYASPVGKV